MSKKSTLLFALILYLVVSGISYYFFSQYKSSSVAQYVKPEVTEEETISLVDNTGPKTKECPFN